MLPRGLLVLFCVVVLGSVIWYGLRTYRSFFPPFTEVVAPSGAFAVAFPGSPIWSDQSPTGLTADYTRRYRNYRYEVYRVRVVPANRDSRESTRAENDAAVLQKAQEFAQQSYREYPAVARLANVPGFVCANFQRRDWTSDDTIAGRVYLEGDRYYILSVIGPDVALDDWRVQRFLNSLQFREP